MTKRGQHPNSLKNLNPPKKVGSRKLINLSLEDWEYLKSLAPNFSEAVKILIKERRNEN